MRESVKYKVNVVVVLARQILAGLGKVARKQQKIH